MAIIETTNLTKRYGELIALNALNLSIEDGECFGFIGPNGAGKTTTIKVLATLLKPSAGQATIDGYTVGHQNRNIRPIIGYVPDYMGTYDDMNVSEYLEFFASCYSIHGADRKRVVSDVLELTDLTYKSGADITGLSRGMQQRLSIARVLLHDPKVLLLDEPASGLDPRARIEMRELLQELKRMGKTIIISSHILHELAELCNTVGMIEQGKLLFHGSVGDAINKARVGLTVRITVRSRSKEAGEALVGLQGIQAVTLEDDRRADRSGLVEGDGKCIRLTINPEDVHRISDLPSILVNKGFQLTGFDEEAVNLETAFMRLTQGAVQ